MRARATDTGTTAGQGNRRPGAAAPRENVYAVCLAAAALLVMAWLCLRGGVWPDWQVEARPAVRAMMAGHVLHFLQLAPIYGGSLILRAPFMLLTKLWHGGDDAVYQASVMPSLVALGALGVWLRAQLRARGSSKLAADVALLLCVGNPLILPALQFGHPEELLSAVLCIAAMLCALDDRPTWAAVLLGLAIGNKEWAVLAVGPVLVALPRARLRALLIIGAVAAALIGPFVLVTSGGFAGQATQAGLNTGAIFQPWQLWWFFGAHAPAPTGMFASLSVGYRVAPEWLGSLGHTLVIAIMPPLCLLYARLRRGAARAHRHDVLLLLALMLALRCVLDPWDTAYYSLPFLLTLLTWESLRWRRPPLITLAATFAAWFIFRETSYTALNLPGDTQAMIFTLVTLPSLIVLTAAVYAPGAGRLLAPRRGQAPSAASA